MKPRRDANIDRVKRDQMRAVLIHEHGHRVVSEHFGCLAWIEIDHPEDATDEYSTFEGRCLSFDQSMTPDEYSVYGVAGIAAEFLNEDPVIDAFQIFEYVKSGFTDISSADNKAALCNGPLNDGQFDEALKILRARWAELQSAVERDFKIHWHVHKAIT